MGVMGAFIFAARKINFTIPGTGSSGHLGGGMILAILLGPYAGFLTMASVLAVQALFFADGGLVALGCNIFNLGFLTAAVVTGGVLSWFASSNPDGLEWAMFKTAGTEELDTPSKDIHAAAQILMQLKWPSSINIFLTSVTWTRCPLSRPRFISWTRVLN